MKNSIKTIFNVQMILATLALTLTGLKCNEYIIYCLWTIAGCFYVLRLSVLIYEDSKLIYPPNKMSRPFWLKTMFRWLIKENTIPKSVMIQMYILFILTVLYVIGFGILGATHKTGYIEIFITSLVTGVLLIVYVYYGIYLTIFYERFKFLNRHNIRYIWGITYKKTCKWPNSELLGKCTVINFVKKEKKQFAEVQMKDNGIIYQDVFVSEEFDAKINGTYKLYEICHVKYIG